jgi:hypothetical protein
MRTLATRLSSLAAGVAVLLAVSFGASVGQPTEDADAAGPTAVLGFNASNCIALGVAFGGLPQTTAASSCNNFQRQADFQDYLKCLRDQCGAPGLFEATPDDFAGLDLDRNLASPGVDILVMAFVSDDFPVRFTTDRGVFVPHPSSGDPPAPGAKNYHCDIASEDPDCDSDPATAGDGVVVARLRFSVSDGTGTANVNVIQENIGFPLEVTVRGAADQIVLEPLFGKSRISTGATPPTASGERPLPTACDFGASVGAVIGAVNEAEKTVVIARVLDNDDEQLAGAALNWTHPPTDPTPQGMVALPTTPMVDLGGTLGIGFPQFICGLDEPGVFETETVFNPTLSGINDVEEKESIEIDVVAPAAEVQLAVDPPEIDCNGTNTATVTATVINEDGDPVANGLDVNFSVVALGIANPLRADTTDGQAKTTVTPLSGAGQVGADGTPRGVTVTVSVRGAREKDIVTGNPASPFRAGPYEYETLQRSILVACSGALPGAQPPPPAGQPGGAGGQPTGSIRPPDTGTALVSKSDALSWWPLLALAAAAVALGGARLVVRRLD